MSKENLPYMAAVASKDLFDSVTYLLDEVDASPSQFDHTDTWEQLQILKSLLCQRSPHPKLPEVISRQIESVLRYSSTHRLLTPVSSIASYATFDRPGHNPLRLSVWRGDVTSLSEVTAIVNAANSQMLGCFQPSHRCIDNVIHSAAGPGLRNACAQVMANQNNRPEPVGAVKVTAGFCLPAKYILHTVGPQLDAHDRRMLPSSEQCEQLASCYRSCLDALEQLPVDEYGRLSIAFCCISTGLFAFPRELATKIAVGEVTTWISRHPDALVTDVIFDVFLEEDQRAYMAALSEADLPRTPPSASVTNDQILVTQSNPYTEKARVWVAEADYLIISAGAGLSASAGLDYTSTALFSDRFPGFLDIGLRRLYDVIGYNGWLDNFTKWGYYFSHMAMVRSWPKSPVYQALLSLTKKFGQDNYFIRTSNADGFFVGNGFPADHVSTPQGQYRYLQCFAKCRLSAVFEAQRFVDAALPFIDPKTQVLQDPSLIPVCEYCGGELTLCVRGGDYFNDSLFQTQNRKWWKFIKRLKDDSSDKKAVILELGVGLNTPGVLRWPNEDLVEGTKGRVRLIRAGLGASGCVPWELEASNAAVAVEGGCDGFIGDLIGTPVRSVSES